MTGQQQTPNDVPCGRLDDHDRHEWTRPRLLMAPPRRYRCDGPPVIEGGNPARAHRD